MTAGDPIRWIRVTKEEVAQTPLDKTLQSIYSVSVFGHFILPLTKTMGIPYRD